MARIGIDLDGCLYNCQESIWRWAVREDEVGTHAARPNGEWYLHDMWEQDDEQFLQMCHRGVDAGVIFGPGEGLTYPGARAALQRLIDEGHEVIIITARTFWGSEGMAQRNTERWLDEEGIPYTELHYSIDKTIVPTDYFVEDKASNYDALLATGCLPILIDRPWNEEPDDRIRVDGIRHFVDRVLFIEAHVREASESMARRGFYLKDIAAPTVGEVRSVSSTGAEKGVKPERFDLIPVLPLTQLARLYGVGAKKYAARNYERGYEWSKSYAALQRHLNLWWSGEDCDDETGVPHVINAAWHCFALALFMQTHPEMDDRPKEAL